MMLVGNLMFSPVPKITAEVDRTEDNDMAVTLVYVDNGFREDYYQFDIPQTDYNERKADGEDLNVDTAIGYFCGEPYNFIDPKTGDEIVMYQFKSIDNEVWWCLTENEMGFVPRSGQRYILAYYQNGTTKENHTCPEEYDCECYCYDDVFLGVYAF